MTAAHSSWNLILLARSFHHHERPAKAFHARHPDSGFWTASLSCSAHGLEAQTHFSQYGSDFVAVMQGLIKAREIDGCAAGKNESMHRARPRPRAPGPSASTPRT